MGFEHRKHLNCTSKEVKFDRHTLQTTNWIDFLRGYLAECLLTDDKCIAYLVRQEA